MSIPPIAVKTARSLWKWQWNQLMNGLAPANKKGQYQRPQSKCQNIKIANYEEFKDREKIYMPRIIIGRSCPWAHRTWLIYKLRNLEDTLNLTIAKADHKEGLWKLEEEWLGCNSLISLYRKCGESPELRATVPVIIDPGISNKAKPRMVGNESAELIEILNKWPTNNATIDLYPEDLRGEINSWQNLLQTSVNDGVYRCGFARNQFAYNQASEELFATLSKVEQSLAKKGPWLCGERITLADIKLFPTMIRWEMVYMPLFGCSKQPLWEFKNIWQWRQKLFAQPKVAETCDSEAWRNDYFGALFPLNPSNIVPAGGNLSKTVTFNPPFKDDKQHTII